jgi:hypothetical protein
MPYVNGPMILAHRIICEQTGRTPFLPAGRRPGD